MPCRALRLLAAAGLLAAAAAATSPPPTTTAAASSVPTTEVSTELAQVSGVNELGRKTLSAAPPSGVAVLAVTLAGVGVLASLVGGLAGAARGRAEKKRALAWIGCVRAFAAAVLLAGGVPGFIALVRWLVKGGRVGLADGGGEIDIFVWRMVAEAFAKLSSGRFEEGRGMLGIGEELGGVTAGSGWGVPAIAAWILATVVILAVCVAGAVIWVFAEMAPARKRVFFVGVVQVLMWVAVSVGVSYGGALSGARPIPLGVDWLDRVWVDEWSRLRGPEELKEGRFLSGWWVEVQREGFTVERRSVGEFRGMRAAFCDAWNSKLPGLVLEGAEGEDGLKGTGIDDDGELGEGDSGTPGTGNDGDGGGFVGDSVGFPEPEVPVRQVEDDEESGSGDGFEEDESLEGEVEDEESAERDEEEDDEDEEEEEEDFTSAEAEAERAEEAEAERLDINDFNITRGETYFLPEAGRNLTSFNKNSLERALLVYHIGKPLGLGGLQALNYFMLPIMTLAPALIAQFLTRWYLWPLVIIWFGLVLALSLFATPAALRPALLPRLSAQAINFCGQSYLLRVASDSDSVTLWRLDLSFIGLVALSAVVCAFSWLASGDNAADDGVRDAEFGKRSTFEKDQRKLRIGKAGRRTSETHTTSSESVSEGNGRIHQMYGI